MRQVDLLCIVIGEAAQVVQLVEVGEEVGKGVSHLLRRLRAIHLAQLLLKDLDEAVKGVIDRVKVKVGSRVLIARELNQEDRV